MKTKKNLKKELWNEADKSTVEFSQNFETPEQLFDGMEETARLTLLLRKAVLKDYPPKKLRASIFNIIRK